MAHFFLESTIQLYIYIYVYTYIYVYIVNITVGKSSQFFHEIVTIAKWLSPVVDGTFLWNEAVIFFCGDVTFSLLFSVIKSIAE